jgi:hypothetical protein
MKLNPDELRALALNMRASEEVEVLLLPEQNDRLFKEVLGYVEPDDEE